MLLGIDHVIIACADPDAAAIELESQIGLRASGGGRHDAHGTFNRLFWLGDSYVELMGVFDSELAAESWWGAHMARLLDSAPAALAGVAFATDDLEGDVQRLRAQRSAITDPVDGQRVRADGQVVRWRIGRLPAPDSDLGLVFLIEHDPGSAEWRPEERATRAAETHPTGTTARLMRVELAVANVRDATLRLLRDLGLSFRPSLAGGGARDTSIGAQTLRLAPSRSSPRAPTTVIRAGPESRAVTALGVDWVLEPALRV
ncbi:MAG: VOC family protein [Candidatus Limnocylindrales bacterium]